MTIAPQPPLSARFNHWLRRMGLFVLGLMLLWLLAWLAVPPILKSQLQLRLGEQLGRDVTVGQLDFKPWSLELELRDLAIAPAQAVAAQSAQAVAKPGTDAQLHISRLYINMELQSLLRLAPVVDAVSVESVHLKLRHLGQGHYDVDDVLARFASQPTAPDASPLKFALYNLVLQDGALEFTDVAQGKVQHLSDLKISLPFLSNLDAHREVQVQPMLAFNLNGSRFDSSAQTTPFARVQKGDVRLALNRLDIAPYLGYWPASLPARLSSAVLDADLKLAFEHTQPPHVSISGTVSASGVKLQAVGKGATTPGASELLEFDRLNVEFKSLRPLERVAQLSRIDWQQPHLTLRRNKQGKLNWLTLTGADGATKNATKVVASSAYPISAGAQKKAVSAAQVAAPLWRLGVDDIALQGGEIRWLDESLAAPARWSLTGLTMQAQALAWPFTQPMPFQGQAMLGDATLGFKGQATDQVLQASATLADWPLALASPYLAQHLTPKLDGVLSAELGVSWKADPGANAAAQLVLKVPSLTLDKLVLAEHGKTRLASIAQIRIEGGELDLAGQTVTLARARVSQPQTSVSRGIDGRWNVESWTKTSSGTDPVPAKGAVLGASAAVPVMPWVISVQDFSLSEGSLGFQDALPAQPVALDVSALSLQLKNFSSAATQPFGLNLTAQVRHGNTEPGRLAWRGSSHLSPLAAQGELTVKRLPLHALSPYVRPWLNVALLRSDTSYKGQLQLAQQSSGWAVKVRGDASFEDVLVHTLAQPLLGGQATVPTGSPAPAEELLSCKSLAFNGLDVTLTPGVAPSVQVQSTVLSDFYARLILSEAGRLNLQDVLKSDPAGQSELASVPASGAQFAIKKEALGASATSASTGNVVPSGPTPLIRFGPASLLGGRVYFTDRFIKPNYSASLTELSGKLGAFSSQAVQGQVQLAELDLRGRVEGSATLEITGRLNPLAKPLALDIKGRVRDLELPALSAYSVRYAGYGIERGKLSVDVAYLVQPDGMLTATNNIVLNQLKFGDKVPDATTSLPVKLAVALLADRNGVIDLNLPVSGSLNDPQFRLMPIVFKIIGNLIVKAVTAPFSLLASAFGGGGEEMSMVIFPAGRATLSPEARTGLDKVVKLLQERPSLKMTVAGTASLEHERDAFKRAQLHSLVLAEKRRTDKTAVNTDAGVPSEVSEQQYPVLLKAVYQQADFPKPRNLIGLTKDIPLTEMQALLLANLTAQESDMTALALKRGVAVRDYLASQKLPGERLFLGAVKAVTVDAKWQPRAELSLAVE